MLEEKYWKGEGRRDVGYMNKSFESDVLITDNVTISVIRPSGHRTRSGRKSWPFATDVEGCCFRVSA